tara:strand:+ start:507 stop:665 length:159 start_codon:yes stop_codon:yes gene_type:complete
MKKVRKKDYPLILRAQGRLYKSLYGKWSECDSKGRFLSRRNVIQFIKRDEKK